jgi:putative transposase
MKCPAEVYQPSTRTDKGLPDIDYPFHDKIIVVTNCGRICLGRKKINFGTVFRLFRSGGPCAGTN